MDVLFLLDRLEEILTTGFRVPMSARTMIDEQEALDIIEQMRLALPKELERARQTIAERDHQIAALRNSTSWRITQPMRAISAFFRNL